MDRKIIVTAELKYEFDFDLDPENENYIEEFYKRQYECIQEVRNKLKDVSGEEDIVRTELHNFLGDYDSQYSNNYYLQPKTDGEGKKTIGTSMSFSGNEACDEVVEKFF